MQEKIRKAKTVVKPRPPKAITAVLHHKDKQIEFLNRLVIVMGAFQAFATLPQAYQLWDSQDASGLSLLSWLYYAVFSVVLLVFGVLQKQKPLVITYASSLIVYVVIVVGIILYR